MEQSIANVPLEELSFLRRIEARNGLQAPSADPGPRPIDPRALIGLELTLEAVGRELHPDVAIQMRALPYRFWRALLAGAHSDKGTVEPNALFHTIAREGSMSLGDARRLGISILEEMTAALDEGERAQLLDSISARWSQLTSDPDPRRQHTPDTPTA